MKTTGQQSTSVAMSCLGGNPQPGLFPSLQWLSRLLVPCHRLARSRPETDPSLRPNPRVSGVYSIPRKRACTGDRPCKRPRARGDTWRTFCTKSVFMTMRIALVASFPVSGRSMPVLITCGKCYYFVLADQIYFISYKSLLLTLMD
jgi:hypothetical protein